MNSNIEIRLAGAADEGEIQICAQEAYVQYVDAIGRRPAPMLADFKTLIAAGHVHVAADDYARILGFVVFFPEDKTMLLDAVAVKPTATGRGIGKRLIALCESETLALGLTAVKLYTNEKMTANLSIYPHLGYRETGRRNEDGFHRVFFSKDI